MKASTKTKAEAKQLYNEIKALSADLNTVFEWHDGILVESMLRGGLLLIDEISLANDSVLERLNSVFERERVLTLSERSSAEAIKIRAAESFNVVATMNPSGDFGKKELSPALRNRMTEIWVDSYFSQPSLLSLYPPRTQATSSITVHGSLSPAVSATDLFMIIHSLADQEARISLAIFNMICFVIFPLTQTFSALQRKPLSIRDVVNCLDFVKVTIDKFRGSRQAGQDGGGQEQGKEVAMAVHHAV